jgi:hypothetical protein
VNFIASPQITSRGPGITQVETLIGSTTSELTDEKRPGRKRDIRKKERQG